MARRMLLIIAATAVAALAVPAVPAGAGGGGCHGDATSGEGDTVEIADGCFGPTTLQVAPGDTVTFVNLDPYQHNVSAVDWGHIEPMNEGDSFEATFGEAGVYPFACQYHPGMTGAIVVGNGAILAGGTPAVSDTAADTEIAASAPAASSPNNTTTGWVTGGAIGLAAGIAIGALVRRRIATNNTQGDR